MSVEYVVNLMVSVVVHSDSRDDAIDYAKRFLFEELSSYYTVDDVVGYIVEVDSSEEEFTICDE